MVAGDLPTELTGRQPWTLRLMSSCSLPILEGARGHIISEGDRGHNIMTGLISEGARQG